MQVQSQPVLTCFKIKFYEDWVSKINWRIDYFFCYLPDIIIVWINPWKYKNVDNTTVQCWVSDVKTKALTQTKNLFMAS